MKENRRPWVSFLALACALVMLTCGCVRGEVPVVFQKAVRVCLECIGLG